MQVNGAGYTPSPSGPGRGNGPKRSSEGAPIQATEASAVSDAEKLRPAKGVLRLLQEGHFKGVADVRLRINFADEIAALQAQVTGARAEGAAQTVLGPVDTVIEEFSGQEGLDEELLGQIQDAAKAFRDAVNGLFDAFDPTADPTGTDLASAIEDAFQAFVEALQALAPDENAEETPEVTEVTPVEVEGEVPPPEEFGFGEFIDRLGEAFEAAIAELRDSFQSAQILPELSVPQGNGGAYAKFLDILNGLTGGGGDSESPGVNTAA